MSSTSLPFDFFAGIARRIAVPRAAVRHAAAPAPLTVIETALYVTLAGALFAGLAGLILHHHAFVVGRVAVEDAERRNTPELLGDLIREEGRVIGVSIQQVFDVARVDPPKPPRAIASDMRALDGALAAAPRARPAAAADDDADEPVVLARPAAWQPNRR